MQAWEPKFKFIASCIKMSLLHIFDGSWEEDHWSLLAPAWLRMQRETLSQGNKEERDGTGQPTFSSGFQEFTGKQGHTHVRYTTCTNINMYVKIYIYKLYSDYIGERAITVRRMQCLSMYFQKTSTWTNVVGTFSAGTRANVYSHQIGHQPCKPGNSSSQVAWRIN